MARPQQLPLLEPDWASCTRCGRWCSIRTAIMAHVAYLDGSRLEPWLCQACQRATDANEHRWRHLQALQMAADIIAREGLDTDEDKLVILRTMRWTYGL